MKSLILKTIYIFSAFAILANCASTKKSVHGEGPLIDKSQIVIEGDPRHQVAAARPHAEGGAGRRARHDAA